MQSFESYVVAGSPEPGSSLLGFGGIPMDQADVRHVASISSFGIACNGAVVRQCVSLTRPKGPPVNRPGREAGEAPVPGFEFEEENERRRCGSTAPSALDVYSPQFSPARGGTGHRARLHMSQLGGRREILNVKNSVLKYGMLSGSATATLPASTRRAARETTSVVLVSVLK